MARAGMPFVSADEVRLIAEVPTGTTATIKTPIRALLGRRKRKATRASRRAVRGGF
jgi:hypothetical protein